LAPSLLTCLTDEKPNPPSFSDTIAKGPSLYFHTNCGIKPQEIHFLSNIKNGWPSI
jgi:hypothetical protein